MARTSRKIAKKYAQSLFWLCAPESLDAVRAGLLDLAAALREFPELRYTLRNPAIEIRTRIEVLREVSRRIRPDDPIFANFASLLLQNGRLDILPQVAEVFAKMTQAYKKLLSLQITSAFDLREEERNALTHEIGRRLGPQVAISWYVNPNILGGMIVRAGDRVLDGSVKGSLERMRSQLLM
jgi:F-type H+-transporting ATPase subunit delta